MQPNDMNLTAFREKVRKFILGEMEEVSAQIERTGEAPGDLFKRMAAQDLLRLTLPPQYGGYGLSLTDYFPIFEITAQSAGTVRMVTHVSNGIWRLLHDFGSEEQKQAFLPAMGRGEKILGFALTEPDAGTGADIKTSATRQGDGWVLNGTKHLITWADISDSFLVVAYTNPSLRQDGISMFLVPRDTPGLKIEMQPEGMGLHGCGHGELKFQNCRVPASALVGVEGQGLNQALRGFLDVSRISIGASCVGMAQRALDLATDFSKRRITFGKAIATRQAMQMLIGEMVTDVMAGRLLVMDAAARVDRGEPATRAAAMAKLFGLEMVGRVTDRALQMFGGIGYLKTHTIERVYRDARAVRFEEGTAEIQKTVIARDWLGM